jgi:PAS domain S-box-containing protein
MSTGKGKSHHAFWVTTLLIFGTGIILSSMSFYLADVQFRRDMERRSQEVNVLSLNHALTVAQTLNRSFAQADTILQFMKLEVELHGGVDLARAGLLKQLLQTGVFNQIAVADARGNLVHSAAPLPAPINISDREHFLAHIHLDLGKMYIAPPRINQVAGVTSIFLSRRLNNADGSFAGIVSVGIFPDYFSKQVELFQPGAYDSFVLLTTEGTFLARVPNVTSPEFIASFKTHPVLAHLKNGVSFGIYESPGAGDGVARIGAFNRLPDYPAVVLVATSKAEAFRAVNMRGEDYRNWSLMFSVVLGTIMFALWWQVRRQYQTEKKLLNNESRLNRAQSIAHVGDWEIELAGRQVWGSAEAYRIYGITQSADYLPLEVIQQVVCEEDRPRVDMAMKALIEKNEKYDVEFKINRLDNGRERAIHSIAELQYDQNGNPIRIIGTIQDVTEQRRSSEELRSTGEHLRKLIQYANAPIIVWNSGLMITRFNRAFERLSGYAADEVIGRPMQDIFSEYDWGEATKHIKQPESGMPSEAVEIPIRCKNGEVRVVLWNFANIFDADAVTLAAVIAQGQDITERVRREKEVRRDTQLANRVQGTLLSEPEQSEFIDVATIYKPHGYVGGDLYFMDWRYEGKMLRGFIIDSTGQGLGAALHTAALHVLLQDVNERDLPLASAMSWLNRRAHEFFIDETFAGALGFEFDLETRQLRWVCAGISELRMNTKTGRGIVRRPGMCLGINAEETFDTHTMAVDVGDSFYFMTDGLTAMLKEHTDPPLENFPSMVGLLRNLSESENRRDDVTAVCIHIRALPHSVLHHDGWPRVIRLNGYGDYQRLKCEVARILAEVTGEAHSLQEVAVNEAIANALECRDGQARSQQARVKFNRIGNRLIVRVKTSRIGFAGNALLRRLRSQPENLFTFGEDASMGRGIPMMLSMSHKMTYNSEGTEVLLVWKLG